MFIPVPILRIRGGILKFVLFRCPSHYRYTLVFTDSPTSFQKSSSILQCHPFPDTVLLLYELLLAIITTVVVICSVRLLEMKNNLTSSSLAVELCRKTSVRRGS